MSAVITGVLDPEEARVQAAIKRLDDQIDWYDRKSRTNQRWFILLKGTEITAAAFIPLFAAFALPAAAGGTLGVLITLLEGALQLGQHQHNWIVYRSTCEALKHDKYLYEAAAGPYTEVARPHALLAERVEAIVSRETGRWAADHLRHKGPSTVDHAT